MWYGASGQQPVTGVIILPPTLAWSVDTHLPRTQRVLAGDRTVRLVPGAGTEPLPAAGGSSHSVLHAWTHGRPLASVKQLTPAIGRQVRDAAHTLRRTGGHIHLFGLLDLDSPYGSRVVVEALVRQLRELHIPVVLHLGVWHPTPREFQQGWQEMATLTGDSVCLGSVFPVDHLLEQGRPAIRRYLDGIHHPPSVDRPSRFEPALPLHLPVVGDAPGLEPGDVLLFANHSLHGLDLLAQELQAGYGHTLQPLAYNRGPNPRLVDALQKRRHVVAVTNTQSGYQACLGGAMGHPYLETVSGQSAEELLEMLCAPHFGYHAPPYRTFVILSPTHNATFDSLLAAYLKKVKQQPIAYYCIAVEPRSLVGSRMVTNGQELYAFL